MKRFPKIISALLVLMLAFSLSILLVACDDETPPAADLGTETVEAIEITTPPSRTNYYTGEEFDPSGMVVSVTLDDGTKEEITDYKYDEIEKLSPSDKAIHVYYGGRVAYVSITVSDIPMLTVSEARIGNEGEELAVYGYYLGASGENELIIKDVNTEAMMEVRGPLSQFAEGDLIKLRVTLAYDGDKPYFAYSSGSDAFTVSNKNSVAPDFSTVTGIASWRRMTSVFTSPVTAPNTYVKIYGDFFVYKLEDAYILHMNPDAKSIDDVKPDGIRTVKIDANTHGAELLSELVGLGGADTLPGKSFTGDLYAVYAEKDDASFRLLISDASWLSARVTVSTEQLAIKEVAYAYYYKGNKIHYDQYGSRRNINPSPELATSEYRLHLDCSSYVNAVYYEAFGENVMPYPTTERSPQTGVMTNYAEEFLGINPDVVGYFETADYVTDEQKAELLAKIKSSLEIGDVLVYRRTAETGHAIIYVGDGYFLHSTGSSYNYVTGNPAASYDQASNAEKAKGTVSLLSVKDVFDNADSGRYLFTPNIARIAVIRPLNRGLSVNNKTASRLTIPGVSIEKTSSVGYASAVRIGMPIIYTISLTNNTENAVSNVLVNDPIPNGTAFVGGSHGAVFADGILTWSGEIAAKSTVNVIYCVTVSENADSVIEAVGGTVNGVALTPLYHTRSAYGADFESSITAMASSVIDSDAPTVISGDPLALINEVYGSEIFGGAVTATAILNELIDSENLTVNTSSSLYGMLVPTLYGGYDIRLGYRTDNQRSRLVVENNLAIGDVIIAESGETVDVFVYCGDSRLVAVSTADMTVKEVEISDNEYNNLLVSLIAYDRYAVLRPSMTGVGNLK